MTPALQIWKILIFHLATNPAIFDWSSLEGTFNLGTLYLSSPCSHLGDNYLSGTFDGNTAFLHGGLSQCAYDGYYYDCNFTAKVIPVSVSIRRMPAEKLWPGETTYMESMHCAGAQ